MSQKARVDRAGKDGTMITLGPETPESLSCPTCRQSFVIQKDLIQHLQEHVGEFNTCSDYGKNFKLAFLLLTLIHLLCLFTWSSIYIYFKFETGTVCLAPVSTVTLCYFPFFLVPLTITCSLS